MGRHLDIFGLYHGGLLETGREVTFAGYENAGRTTVVTFNRRTGLLVTHTTGSQWQNLGKVNKTPTHFRIFVPVDRPEDDNLIRRPDSWWRELGEFDVNWRAGR